MAKAFDDTLLKREITRKEFLRYMLGMFLLVFGINNFLIALQKTVLQKKQTTKQSQVTTTHGFGASKFGR
ncbi:MAG: hypothetical protein WBP12_04660 [Candidatus Saccharimonas sp.]